MELQFKITGTLLMILALIHIGFPKYFEWKAELKPLSLMNKQMMEVHTFFVALIVFMIGLLSLLSSSDLLYSPFGKKISLGIGFFWGVRLLVQFVWYSPKLWKGKTFETIMHVLFSIFWVYLTVLFSFAYFQ